MKKELILILGNTGSGKSTLAKNLKWVHGYDVTVPYTTRSPREGEVDGVDYMFVTNAFFNDFAGIFDAFSIYDGNRYGIKINPDISKQVIVCDATMYSSIINSKYINDDFNITTVLLDLDDDVLLYRCILRGDDSTKSHNRILENGQELRTLFEKYRPDLIFNTPMHVKDISRTINKVVDDNMLKTLSVGFIKNSLDRIAEFTYDLTLYLIEKSKRKGDN